MATAGSVLPYDESKLNAFMEKVVHDMGRGHACHSDSRRRQNPVGRIYYSASTMICTPASLAQEVGAALGAQAGQAQIRGVVMNAGFRRFRRAAETPFNLVFEARP
jgi:hypothetical protein